MLSSRWEQEVGKLVNEDAEKRGAALERWRLDALIWLKAEPFDRVELVKQAGLFYTNW